jgi:hypothetical protein
MKPEPDLRKLARAFLRLAEHQLHGDDRELNVFGIVKINVK